MDKVCLLITSFNRGHLLKNNLQRLCNLTIPDEVLVISDGCSDNTKEVCDSFAGKLPIRYIYNHNPDWSICSYARNIGMKNTDCGIIITAEPELFFMTDLVRQMLNRHAEFPDQVISAGTIYHMGENATLHPDMFASPLERIKKEKVNESRHNPTPNNKKGYAKVVGWQATYSALYKKEWIEQVNYWDEQFPACYGVDDIDICTRIRIKLKVNQIADSDISVIHQWHPKPPGILKDAVQRNMDYFYAKKFSIDGHEDPNNPNLMANQGKEVGIIKTR